MSRSLCWTTIQTWNYVILRVFAFPNCIYLSLLHFENKWRNSLKINVWNIYFPFLLRNCFLFIMTSFFNSWVFNSTTRFFEFSLIFDVILRINDISSSILLPIFLKISSVIFLSVFAGRERTYIQIVFVRFFCPCSLNCFLINSWVFQFLYNVVFLF